jgi:broad specificity phosphatase PhoE
VSNIYLIRHGQAGTRDCYDSLSKLGRQQARLLGEYFASQGIQFTAAYCGQLSRQQQTAEQVSAGAGGNFPGVVLDAGWDEFDLDRMYREIAPQLSAVSATFRSDYEAMRELMYACGTPPGESAHRRWLPCDTELVNAWIDGQHGYTGESWQQFHERVAESLERVGRLKRDDNVAVISSAVPIAISTGLALSIRDTSVMKLAGVLQNASFTILQSRKGNLRLFSFNATPHLLSHDLRTFR